jgi:hypothetical protein
MALRVLLVVVVLLTHYGRAQSSLPPAQSEKEDPEQLPARETREKQQKAPQEILQAPQQAATVACSDFYGPRDTQAYYDTRSTAGDASCEEQEEHAEAGCRMVFYSFASELRLVGVMRSTQRGSIGGMLRGARGRVQLRGGEGGGAA